MAFAESRLARSWPGINQRLWMSMWCLAISKAALDETALGEFLALQTSESKSSPQVCS
jgi:hypothetical protein